ncbi:MAG TPA: sulfotransferase [Acidimicrobiia bacterium]
MTWDPGPRPQWVKDAIDGRFDAVLARARDPFERDALLDEAHITTGLDDFGDDPFVEALDVLIASAEDESRLHVVGRWRLRTMLLGLLANRLKLREYVRHDPEVMTEPIVAPIVVTGAPRSGTSILHQLLSHDPAHRAPRSWEFWCPTPPPEPATYGRDARVPLADAEIRLSAALAPSFDAMHEMSATMPRECIGAQNCALRSDDLPGNFRLPSYQAWLDGADMQPAYAWHRLILQTLQRRMPSRRWVLKAPSHLAALDTLFETYPDAELVITHRDPLTMLASVTSLEATLYWAHSDGVQYDTVAQEQLDRHARLLDGLVDWREHHPGVRVHDVEYWRFVEDPVRAMEELYAAMDTQLTGDARAAIAGHVAAKPQGRHGGHRYSFDDLGLDERTTRARFRRYQDRFGIPDDF